jgi:hypothetical protein
MSCNNAEEHKKANAITRVFIVFYTAPFEFQPVDFKAARSGAAKLRERVSGASGGK